MTISKMKYYKELKGYSFSQLAELSGVPQGTIQKIFRGETKTPRYKTREALERVLRPDTDTETDFRVDEGPDYSPADAHAPVPDRIGEAAVAYSSPFFGYTLEDYYALPEDTRMELIDGRFYDMASPSSTHQMLAMSIGFQLNSYIMSRKGDCVTFMAPMDVQLDGDDRTMLQPDVFVVCDHKKISNRCILGAPDLVIEILSPETRVKDAFLKLSKYRSAGVREYWMVDPDREKVAVYCFADEDFPVIYPLVGKIATHIFTKDMAIDFDSVREQLRVVLPG